MSEIEKFIKLSKEQNDACLPIVLWSEEAKALIDEVETLRNRIAELEAERIKTGLHIKSLEGWIEIMDKKFATLEAERRWISVTERLPEVKHGN